MAKFNFSFLKKFHTPKTIEEQTRSYTLAEFKKRIVSKKEAKLAAPGKKI